MQAVFADQDRRGLAQGRCNVTVFVSDDISPGTRMAGRSPILDINIVFEGVGYAGQVLRRLRRHVSQRRGISGMFEIYRQICPQRALQKVDLCGARIDGFRRGKALRAERSVQLCRGPEARIGWA
ncbi:hypothetical protein D3C72_1526910 [compost metagenome]